MDMDYVVFFIVHMHIVLRVIDFARAAGGDFLIKSKSFKRVTLPIHKQAKISMVMNIFILDERNPYPYKNQEPSKKRTRSNCPNFFAHGSSLADLQNANLRCYTMYSDHTS